MIDFLSELGQFDWLTQYAVVLLRVSGLFVFVPILSSRVVPIRLRIVLAAVLALVLLPLVPLPQSAGGEGAIWLIVVVRELTVGFALGLSARMIIAAIEAASSLVATQSGFAIASMIDPSSGDPTVIPATFHSLLSTALFLAADLHHVFIRVIIDSYSVLPVANTLPAFDNLGRFGGFLGARMLTLAVQLAAPALVLTIASDLVVVLIGKAMPQVPILLVGYPLKMAIGLVAIALLSVSIAQGLAPMIRTLSDDASRLTSALAGS